jgi:hypothetical protein
MATILPTYDWTRASAHIENARSRAYPWEEWLDGQIRKLDRGEDFDGPSMSVERVIRTSANRRGIRVRIRVEGESIYLQAHQEDARNKARGVTKSATKKAVKEAKAAKAEGNGNGVAPSQVVTPKPATTRLASRASKPVKATVAEAPAAPKPARKRAVKTTPVPVEAAAATPADFRKAKASTNGNGKAPAAPSLGDAVASVARKTVRKLTKV